MMTMMRTTALMIASAALGAGAAAAWSAASAPPPKAYVVAEIDVTDDAGYRRYVEQAFPVIRKYGGRFLTRGGRTIAVEGKAPGERVMIIEFDSFEQAKTFEYSADYTATAPLRRKTSTSRLFIVEGAPPEVAERPKL